MSVETWKQWLTQISNEEIQYLKQALFSEDKPEIEVFRMPTETCYVSSPPYIDVFGLLNIYDKLAFKNNILLKGPKGVGKSLSYTYWAAVKNVPIVSVECSEDLKKYDLMGSPFIIGDETIFTLGSIPTAIEIANEVGFCILAFEELNALTPQVQKMLNAIADFRQAVSLPSIGKVYRLREGAKIWIVASLNPTVYGGSYDLNEDLKSRFEEIEVTYPQDTQERMILESIGSRIPNDLLTALLTLAKETRSGSIGYPLSTRDLVRLTNNINVVGIDTTLQMLVGKFEYEDKQIVIKRLDSIFKGIKMPTPYWGETYG